MNQPIRKRLFSRVTATLALMALTAMTAWATTTSSINVGGTDYTLFTGFTATDGNGTNYAKLVDGNTSTDWIATKNYDDPNAPANDFAGGTADPAFVEFHADEAFIPKGYVLTCDHENAGFWKPVEWALKAKLNEGDAWTTIHSSNTTLGAGKTFEIPCTNDGDNQYQYFRFEVYEVGTTMTVDLDELQFYGSLPAYTHLTVKAATCMATGIKVDCYRHNSDGKYFTDETGTTELQESDVIAPIIPHTGEHHEATDVNIEYWQCSMCSKLFSDVGCTTEITEEDTKIYRTITIDNSISGLVEVGFGRTQALAGETVLLRVMDDRIDISTLKVNDGAVEVIPDGGDWYKFTMPAADVTVTAEVAQSNVDGDILTGSIKHRVTITDGASITLNNATITGSIVCEGSATITLVGTNSVSGATNKAGIQIGGSGTTLTIRGEGSLTVNGGDQSAGIGLSRAWNVTEDVVGGNIVINGGNITANGGGGGAGIGAGVTKDPNNSSSRKAIVGTITIVGGSVTAVGGSNADGIGAGENNYNATIQIGTVTIYDGIDKVDASSITNFGSVVYMHNETDVTASKTDYFAIGEDGNRRLIVQKPVIAEIAEQAYTGSEIKPEPTVTIGSLTLTKGTDYVYSYTNNTNVGTATVRATFQGTYASLGYVEKTFTIGKGTPTVTAPTPIENLVYTGSALALVTAGSADFGTLVYSLEENGTYSADIPTATAAGDYTVYYKVEASDNWNAVDAASVAVTIAYYAASLADDADNANAISNIVTNYGGKANVTLTGRTLYKDGKWNTLCLPFALSAEQIAAHADFSGATLMELDKDGKNGFDPTDGTLYLTFKAATTIAAGVPYLVKWDAAGTDFTSPTFSGVTIDATASTTVSDADGDLQEVQMVGCYSPVPVVADDKSILFLGDANTLYYSSIDRDIRSCRAYFSVPYIKQNAGAKARAFRLDFGDGEQTGIMTVQGEGFTVNGSDAWYTLDGRKLDGKPATKGLYINGGKKVVIK